jgi:prepilin-type N-terminal cleavage/methylation domain-containing protein
MMPTKSVNKKQGGFTLIEIAIVLVIIGLLLGGVLKGQELINTARVRALNNSVDGITAAWFSFQDRYRAFPGDYLDAKSKVNLPGALAGGNGNGLVDTEDERGRVWTHLEAAGYITGGYSGAKLAAGKEYTCESTICPDNGFGTGMSIFHGANLLSGGGGVNAHELITGQGIPVEVIAELDRKIDDDAPATGVMQLGNTGFTACVTGTPQVYNLQNPSDNCAAVFRNF